MSVNKLLTFINHNHDRRQLIAGRSEYNCIKLHYFECIEPHQYNSSQCHSQSRRILTALFTKPPSTVLPVVGMTLRDCSPFSGIVQGKAGNGSAGGFVNSAVSNWLFPKSHWLE